MCRPFIVIKNVLCTNVNKQVLCTNKLHIIKNRIENDNTGCSVLDQVDIPETCPDVSIALTETKVLNKNLR